MKIKKIEILLAIVLLAFMVIIIASRNDIIVGPELEKCRHELEVIGWELSGIQCDSYTAQFYLDETEPNVIYEIQETN